MTEIAKLVDEVAALRDQQAELVATVGFLVDAFQILLSPRSMVDPVAAGFAAYRARLQKER